MQMLPAPVCHPRECARVDLIGSADAVPGCLGQVGDRGAPSSFSGTRNWGTQTGSSLLQFYHSELCAGFFSWSPRDQPERPGSRCASDNNNPAVGELPVSAAGPGRPVPSETERGAVIRAQATAAEATIAEIARARGDLCQSQPLPADRLTEMAAARGEAGQSEDRWEQTGRPYVQVSILEGRPLEDPSLRRALIRRRDGSCDGWGNEDGEGNEVGSEEEGSGSSGSSGGALMK